MKLNESKGNMYEWITHTGNTIKGECPHSCSYCYMKRWGKQSKLHLDEKELSTPTPEGNFIFVGSSCDMFAEDIPERWIMETLIHCGLFENQYLFQTKNPDRVLYFSEWPEKCVFCTTIESNRIYPEMGKARPPFDRSRSMNGISVFHKTYVTIEPIMDFDLKEMVSLIAMCNPEQVNIGADSGNNKLPEPSHDKIDTLIEELDTFTTVKLKANLKRLYENV